MAKVVKEQEEAAKNLPTTPPADLWEGFTAAERQEAMAATGQANFFSMDKTPVLKVNLCGKADVNGAKVDLGNFVIGQNIEEKDGKKTIHAIGKDCGPNPIIRVLKIATQYSYWNSDKRQRCNSQIVIDPSDIAVGSNLGFQCAAKTCHRRQDGIDKKEKCSGQLIVFCEVGDDKDKAIMYVKGTSYMPFKTGVIDAAGQYPVYFFPVVLKTEEKSHGSVDYYELQPEMLVTQPYSIEDRKACGEVVKQIDANVREFEAQRKNRAAAKLPAGTTVIGKGEALPAGVVGDGTSDSQNYDDIAF